LKINKRNRLLKKNKTSKCPLRTVTIKGLNKEIKTHLFDSKKRLITNKITQHHSNIWKAVKIAKNSPGHEIPQNLSVSGTNVDPDNMASAFAVFFHEKIVRFKTNIMGDRSVYNGCNKLIVRDRFFMNDNSIRECLSSLKPKVSEGFGCIPVKILFYACDLLLPTLTRLFKMIYLQKTIPNQWKISKIIPIFKKGNKNQIENYRPISNLCSISKTLEKLILKQINYLETTNTLDLTGKQQHGFKKNKSTATAGLLLQSIIARAANDDNYVIMASLDLSAAFNLVNIELLIRRLRIFGLPSDLISLIQAWLSCREF
jgi:hypothetical protein